MGRALLFTGLLLLACVYALVRGGKPERYAAILYLAAFAASALSVEIGLTPYEKFNWGIVAIDIALANLTRDTGTPSQPILDFMGNLDSNRRHFGASSETSGAGDRSAGLRDNSVGLVLRRDSAPLDRHITTSAAHSGEWAGVELEPEVKSSVECKLSQEVSVCVRRLPKLGCIVSDTSQLLDYLFDLDDGRHDEFVHAFFLDASGRLAWSETLATGLPHSTKFQFRHLICTALRVDATGLILGHNHPSGTAKPSARDVTSTMDLQRICKKIGIELIDHLIVASGSWFSFQSERLLGSRA